MNVIQENDKILVWSNGQFIKCEDEPIHIPGKIQSYGALIAMKVDTWEIRQASENCLDIIGIDVKDLLKSESLREFMEEFQIAKLKESLCNSSKSDDDCGLNVIPFAFKSSWGNNGNALILSHHQSGKNPDLIIMEFEIDADEKYPMNCDYQLNSNVKQTKTSDLGRDYHTHHEHNHFGKLSTFESTLHLFDMTSKFKQLFSVQNTLEDLSKSIADVFGEITLMDRIKVYQFDPDWNGEVIAEKISNPDLPSFLGLHFPHTDIPAQARDLYKANMFRILYNGEMEASRILCRDAVDLNTPLDLSFAYLRSMSPIHLKYLKNMNVISSMTISLICHGKLWGLITCHSIFPQRVSFLGRSFCRVMGEHISKLIESQFFDCKSKLRDQAISRATEKFKTDVDKNLYESVFSKVENLLEIFKADNAIISINNETRILGEIDNSNDLLTLVGYLRLKRFPQIIHTDSVRYCWSDFPSSILKNIAGILHIPLSDEGKDFFCFIRKEKLQKVKWAGVPKDLAAPTNVLEPRNSFMTWVQIVTGKSEAWNDGDCEVASLLQLVYFKIVNVWIMRDSAIMNNKMKNLLLSNVSRIVRTPLDTIINSLESALEFPLEDELKSSLDQAHQSSKGLILIINDLLDLTQIEEGKMLFKKEPFSLMDVIRKAAHMFVIDASRKGLNFEINDDSNIPSLIIGDSTKIRQIIINLCCNAIKFTTDGFVKIIVNTLEISSSAVGIEISVVDSGIGIPENKLSVIFQDFEQVESHLSKTTKGTGLGLAIVSRIVKNLNGHLHVQSELEKGSIFTVVLNFDLPASADSFIDQVIFTRSIPELNENLSDSMKFVYPISERLPQNIPKNDIPEDFPSTSTWNKSSKEQLLLTKDFNELWNHNYGPTKKVGGNLRKAPINVSNIMDIKFNILYAEDDLLNQKILKTRLEKLGHKITICNNGRECVEKFIANPNEYDIILTDVQMPICDGKQAAKEIRQFESDLIREFETLPLSYQVNDGKVPIIAVSATVYDVDIQSCAEAEIDGFVNKPVDIKLLNELLASSASHEKRVKLTSLSYSNRPAASWIKKIGAQIL